LHELGIEMPQQTDPAVPMRLSVAALQQSSQLPRKVRVAGRLGHPYNSSSPYIQLTDGKCSLLVDVSLCLEPFKRSPWLIEKQALAMFIGYLERTASADNGPLVLRALIAQEASDLQLALWDRAIREREDLESTSVPAIA